MRISPIINTDFSKTVRKPLLTPSKPKINKHISAGVSAGVMSYALINADKLSINNIEHKLFDLGYKKDKNHSLRKIFSEKEKEDLKEKYGKYSEDYKKILETPVTKKDLIKFKHLLEIDKTSGKHMLDNNFEKTFQTFCVLNKNNNIDGLIRQGRAGFNLVKEFVQNEELGKDATEDILDYKLDSHYGKGRAIQVALKEKYFDKDFKVEPDVQKYIDNISGTIDKHTLPKGLNLYRVEKPRATLENVSLKDGTNVNLAQMMLDASKSGNPEEIAKVKEFVLDNEITAVNPRFMSTTVDNGVNDSWGKTLVLTKTSVLWKMTTESNTKGLYLEPFNVTGKYAEQKEILLQHGSKMTITNIDFDADKRTWTINAKVSN